MMIFNNDFDLGFNSVHLKKSEGSEIGLKKSQLGRFTGFSKFWCIISSATRVAGCLFTPYGEDRRWIMI